MANVTHLKIEEVPTHGLLIHRGRRWEVLSFVGQLLRWAKTNEKGPRLWNLRRCRFAGVLGCSKQEAWRLNVSNRGRHWRTTNEKISTPQRQEEQVLHSNWSWRRFGGWPSWGKWSWKRTPGYQGARRGRRSSEKTRLSRCKAFSRSCCKSQIKTCRRPSHQTAKRWGGSRSTPS